MARDGGWVGGWVELEVLGVVGGLLLLGVVLGHGGQGFFLRAGLVWCVWFSAFEACEKVVSKP